MPSRAAPAWPSTELTARIAGKASGAPASEIFLASTGVIGEPLDATRFEGVLDRLVAEAREDGIADAARAIMTTDTFPKLATAQAEIGGVKVTINGIAKGAGMIAPDMATMLSFVFTDAPVAAGALAGAAVALGRNLLQLPLRSTATRRPRTR